MKFDLNSLRTYFSAGQKEAAGFFLMLYHMKNGDTFETPFGKVRKLKRNEFKIETQKTLNQLLDIWLEENKDPVDSIFE